jgi:hypothetical protein
VANTIAVARVADTIAVARVADTIAVVSITVVSITVVSVAVASVAVVRRRRKGGGVCRGIVIGVIATIAAIGISYP